MKEALKLIWKSDKNMKDPAAKEIIRIITKKTAMYSGFAFALFRLYQVLCIT